MPRTNCPEHGVRRVAVPWSDPGSRFTRQFEAHAIATIIACQSVAPAARLLRLSWNQARGIMERGVARGMERRSEDSVPHLGIEEKAIRKGQRYVTILTDLDGSRVLEVVADRTTESALTAYNTLTDEQKQAVAAIAMDMWEPFKTAVTPAFGAPQPAVVHDRFHIVAHATKAMSDVRVQEARELKVTGRTDLVGTQHALNFGSENAPERYQPTIDALQASDLRTGVAYALKENLRRCWKHRKASTARRHFIKWIRWARRSGLRPFAAVAEMIDKRIDDIVSYFDHPITNGPQEGLNAKLMAAVRAGRGYRHHSTFRMAALFFAGRLDMAP
jgi:transposase